MTARTAKPRAKSKDYDYFSDADLKDLAEQAKKFLGQTVLYVDDPHSAEPILRVAFVTDAAYVDPAESKYLILHPGATHEAYLEVRDKAIAQFGKPVATDEPPRLHCTLMVIIPRSGQMMTRVGVPFAEVGENEDGTPRYVKYTFHLKCDDPDVPTYGDEPLPAEPPAAPHPPPTVDKPEIREGGKDAPDPHAKAEKKQTRENAKAERESGEKEFE